MSEQKAIQPFDDSAVMSFGQSRMDPADWIPPRVKIVQMMSQEAIDKKAAPGDFWDTLRGIDYGSELRFIPLTTFKNRVLIVRKEKMDAINDMLEPVGKVIEGDGLQCRSLDLVQGNGTPGIECAECPLSVWIGNKPPVCSESYNVSAMNELGDLIILSFSKSAAKTGKRMISMMRMRHEAPWTQVYVAKTRMERNDLGSFAVPDVTPTGERPDDALLRTAQKWITELTGRVIDLTEAEYSEEEATPSEGDAPF